MKRHPSVNLLKTFEESFSELFYWIKDTISPYEVFDFIQILEIHIPQRDLNNKDRVWCYFSFYTSKHKFSFTAVKPYEKESEGFITGEISLRKPLAGEELSGSKSLSGGGSYSKETWIKFIKAIIKYEIVKLSISTYKSI